jgi:hypothetical protein
MNEMADACPVCRTESQAVKASKCGGFKWKWSCPRCGTFVLDEHLADTDGRLDRAIGDNLIKRAVLSHWIRTKYESIKRDESGSESIILTPDLIKSIIRQSPPTCAEQANKFILWLGDCSRPGESIPVNSNTHQSVMGAITTGGFLLVLEALVDAGLVTPTTVGGSSERALTYKGWKHYDELRQGTVDSRTAFMAMQYDDARLDDIVDNVFKLAVEQTGFDLFRLVDQPQPAGSIDDRLRVAIRTSRFLIADLTHENRGAYWEAGYAEGLGKPVIYTCEERKFDQLQTHFDTNHHLTIKWDADDLDCAAQELKATIRATLPAEAKLTDN